MARSNRMPGRLRAGGLAVAGAALLLGAGAAGGAPVVYHSPADDGGAAGAPVVLAAPGDSLFLYVDGGPAASTLGEVCHTGNGDELCAVELRIGASGDFAISAFSPDPGIEVLWSESPAELVANAVFASDGRLGPTRIGELLLDVGGGGNVSLLEAAAVTSDLTLVAAAPGVLALPEPDPVLLLAAGAAGLALLGRGRERG